MQTVRQHFAKAHYSAAGTGDETITGSRRLCSVQAYEAAGTPAAAEVVIRDGSVSGTIIARIKLAASGNAAVHFPLPVLCDGDLFIDRVSGTTEVIVTYVPA